MAWFLVLSLVTLTSADPAPLTPHQECGGGAHQLSGEAYNDVCKHVLEGC